MGKGDGRTINFFLILCKSFGGPGVGWLLVFIACSLYS